MLSLFQILNMLLDLVWFFIIAHIIMSWLINFQVLKNKINAWIIYLPPLWEDLTT